MTIALQSANHVRATAMYRIAAADLRRIVLVDALSLRLLISDDDPLRYDRAAVR